MDQVQFLGNIETEKQHQSGNVYGVVVGVNEHDDGCCRTIKNQYFKNSISNFESQGTFGASGVIEIWKLKKQ